MRLCNELGNTPKLTSVEFTDLYFKFMHESVGFRYKYMGFEMTKDLIFHKIWELADNLPDAEKIMNTVLKNKHQNFFRYSYAAYALSELKKTNGSK